MRDIHVLHPGWLVGAAVIALAIPLTYAPLAMAAVDCAKSPTYLRKVPGGQELVFHPECEPPAVMSRSGKTGPTMLPVSASASAHNPAPVVDVGAGVGQPIPDVAAQTQAAPSSKGRSGPQSANRVRVQGYTRVRSQY